MMPMNIEPYLKESIVRDLRNAVNHIPAGRKLRLVRIPVFDFNDAISAFFKKSGMYIPFRPVVLNNIPTDMTENILPECILVADDNTNISKTMIKETEFFKGES